jgi:hypothetical protein
MVWRRQKNGRFVEQRAEKTVGAWPSGWTTHRFHMPWRDGSTYAYKYLLHTRPGFRRPHINLSSLPSREYFPPSHPSNRLSTHLVAVPLRIANLSLPSRIRPVVQHPN